MFRKTLLCLSIAGVSFAAQAETTVFHNANGYGFDDNRQLVNFSTLVVEDGKVVARGDKAVADDYTNADNDIDAQGKTLLPGLIDAHGHFMALGYSLLEVDLRDLESAKQSAEKVAEFASRNPNFEWVRGGGWNQVLWEGKEFPTAEVLDAQIADRPVMLSRVDHHAIWVNSKAMELAGIDADTQAPDGGEIIKDKSGNPTGVFIDNAEQLITDKIPTRSAEEMAQAFDTAVAHLQEVGITSVHDAGASAAELALYRDRADDCDCIRWWPQAIPSSRPCSRKGLRTIRKTGWISKASRSTRMVPLGVAARRCSNPIAIDRIPRG
ncbi:amidohydrolase [Halomonas sp. PR-M31]|uniref:amidohydrolase n=1 Tax=Halomonas sp. PR-M31 TaxID=1471202 RepID=UPI000A6802F1|nr:amidohydrolase family protein [Halomonas sp. PR-M31]